MRKLILCFFILVTFGFAKENFSQMSNQEKMQKRMFFDQLYWLKVTVLLKKKPTCFQVG
jgi:hypothetical protein